MAMPPFLARLIGDRSAVLPSQPTDVLEAIRETRFAQALATNVNRSSPYTPALTGRDFPAVPTGWHPGTPPVNVVRGVSGIARNPLPNATVKPPPQQSVPQGLSLKIGTTAPIGNQRKVVGR